MGILRDWRRDTQSFLRVMGILPKHMSFGEIDSWWSSDFELFGKDPWSKEFCFLAFDVIQPGAPSLVPRAVPPSSPPRAAVRDLSGEENIPQNQMDSKNLSFKTP